MTIQIPGHVILSLGSLPDSTAGQPVFATCRAYATSGPGVVLTLRGRRAVLELPQIEQETAMALGDEIDNVLFDARSSLCRPTRRRRLRVVLESHRRWTR